MYGLSIEGDKGVLTLSGDVDLQTTADLKSEIATLRGISVLEIDASGVDYIDSSGIAVLLMTRQHCGNLGIALELSVISEPVYRVLHIAKLDQLFAIGRVITSNCGGLDNYGFSAESVKSEEVEPSAPPASPASPETETSSEGESDAVSGSIFTEEFKPGSFG